MRPAIDSRQYIVALELRSTDDCPPDFELPSSVAGSDAGLFLPRDDPDWFGRAAYPPRVLLLTGSTLHMVSHPSAGEPPRRWELERISSVESGHMLLKGWLRFIGAGFDCTLRYNTRGFPPVFRFMQRFRAKLLGSAPQPGTAPVRFGCGLDIKFANALAAELDSGEAVPMQAFQPPREIKSRRWLLPRRRMIAGDLLALTDRRLLWITDCDRGSYSRFGSIATYAPFDAVRGIGLVSGRGGDMIQVDLNGGPAWQFPMAPESYKQRRQIVEDFAAALHSRPTG
jgi:hypothetical protein